MNTIKKFELCVLLAVLFWLSIQCEARCSSRSRKSCMHTSNGVKYYTNNYAFFSANNYTLQPFDAASTGD